MPGVAVLSPPQLGAGILGRHVGTPPTVVRSGPSLVPFVASPQPRIYKRVLSRIGMPVINIMPPRIGAGLLQNVGPRFYSTSFPLTENPISELSNWSKGSALTNMQTTSGRCFGTQTGSNGDDDSVAALTRSTWKPNQSASVTIHKAGSLSGSGLREIELILHFVGGHWIECNLAFDGSYQDVVYIINPGGGTQGTDYVFLNATPGTGGPGSVSDGEKFTATWVNGVITTYLNGVFFQSCSDTSPLLTGAPGLGAFIQGSGIVSSEYCASSYSAIEL